MHRRAFGLGTAASFFSRALAKATAAPTKGVVDGPRLAARGKATHLVVLLHGYGGDGQDMFGLAPALQAYAPSASFVAPNGPVRAVVGYCWFPTSLPPRPEEFVDGPAKASPVMNAFFDAELAKAGLGPDRLILVGFSQGAIIALNLGVRRATPPAAIVSFAGANLSALDRPTHLVRDRPPILLIQGGDDPQARRGAQEAVVKILTGLGAQPQAHTLPGLGHGIDERGIRIAGEMLRMVTRA